MASTARTLGLRAQKWHSLASQECARVIIFGWYGGTSSGAGPCLFLGAQGECMIARPAYPHSLRQVRVALLTEIEIDLGLYLNDTKLMGKGLGKIIIRKGVDGIRKQVGKIPICLDVRLTNKRAIRCYEALGFKKVFEAEKITPAAKIKYQRMVLEI